MPVRIDSSVEGLDDAKRAIEELTGDLRKKVVIAALKAAGRPMLQQARFNAPQAAKSTNRVIPGLIKRTLAIFTSKIKQASNGVLGIYIRPRTIAKVRRAQRSAKRAGIKGPNFGDPFYYRFQEEGFHAVGRVAIKGGKKSRAAQLATGKYTWVPGKHFIGDAFVDQSQNAIAIFTAEIKKRIDKANARKP